MSEVKKPSEVTEPSEQAKQAERQTRQYIAWGQRIDDAVMSAIVDVFEGEGKSIKGQFANHKALFKALEDRGDFTSADFQAAMDSVKALGTVK